MDNDPRSLGPPGPGLDPQPMALGVILTSLSLINLNPPTGTMCSDKTRARDPDKGYGTDTVTAYGLVHAGRICHKGWNMESESVVHYLLEGR